MIVLGETGRRRRWPVLARWTDALLRRLFNPD